MSNSQIAAFLGQMPQESQNAYVALANRLRADYLKFRESLRDSAGKPIEPARIENACFFIVNNNLSASFFAPAQLSSQSEIEALEKKLNGKINQKIYCHELNLSARQALIRNPSDSHALAAFVGEAAFHLFIRWHKDALNMTFEFAPVLSEQPRKKFLGLF